MTRLSVIIPGYNTPKKWWQRCLRSVLAAIGPDDEIICVDDGSKTKPSTLQLQLDTPTPPIRWLYLDHNVGQAAARNKALEIAQGDWISFVDSDDEVMSNAYADCFKQLQKDPADIALFGVRVIWTDEGVYKDDVPRGSSTHELSMSDIQELFKGCLFEYPVNRILKRSFLEEHKIRFDAGICPGEDTVFNLKTLLAGARFCCVPTVGYVYYRTYSSSLARYQAKFDESLRLRNDYWRQVNRRLGVTDEPKMFGVLSEAELSRWSVENKWRFDTPLSLAERWRFPLAVFLRAELKSFVRRYLYIRPLRRWKIRQTFPEAKNLP